MTTVERETDTTSADVCEKFVFPFSGRLNFGEINWMAGCTKIFVNLLRA